MFTRSLTIILLAAGLAVTKPINNPHDLQKLAVRQIMSPTQGVCATQGSGMITALFALESKAQEEVTQIDVRNLIVINVDADSKAKDNNNGRNKDNNDKARNGSNADAARKQEAAATQQLVLQQVNQVLLADQRANGAQKELDNVLRIAALSQREREKSTVILIVQEIKVSIEVDVQANKNKKEKTLIEAAVFKQEVIVANRGKRETKTVMLYDARTMTATGAAAQATNATNTVNATTTAKAGTRTAEAVLYNARPTHSATIEDPAAAMREALEVALSDRRNDENRKRDEEVNVQIAIEIKVEIEKSGRGKGDGGDKNNGNDDKDRERQRQQEQEKKDSDQKKADQNREAEQKKAKMQDEERQKQKQEEDRVKAEADKKQTEEKQKQEEAKAEATPEQKVQAER